jgi:signal transduction histidine kinase
VLRIPIERIVTEAQQISERSDGPLRSDYAGYGGDIAAAARHLLSVISTMGDNGAVGRRQIDLSALAAEAVVLVEPVAESRKIEVVLDAAPPTPASGEEHAVIQILVNLLVNAIRHSPEQGVVRLGFASQNRVSSVTVADQGVGIAAEDVDRIFQPFHGTFARGSGLGLAIVHRIVSDYDGEIEVSSAVGKGTVVRVRLGQGSRQPAAGSWQQAAPLAAQPRNKA